MPQMWRISEDEADAARPLMPRTLDQPQRDSSPIFPRRSAPQPAPPSYRPASASNPPSYAPGSGRAAQAASSGSGTYAPSGNGPRQVTINRSQAAPVAPPRSAAPASAPRPRRKRRHPILKTLCLFLVIILAWGGFLLWDANTNMGRVSALSGAADTPGTTYLLAGSDSRADGAVKDGSDSRADGAVKDGFDGSERADSIMLVNVAPNGQAVALSIPRDT